MKKFQYNSPVILSFFLVSLFALILGWLSNDRTTALFFSVYRSSLMNPLTFVRFFGHILGHADFEHFLGNMLMLLVVGPPLEERYGSKVLLTGILLTALVSGLLQTALFPDSALLGASGIVFMLIMLSSLSYRRRMRNGIWFRDQQKTHCNKALLQIGLQQVQNHHIVVRCLFFSIVKRRLGSTFFQAAAL